jgi:hypothetical protein
VDTEQLPVFAINQVVAEIIDIDEIVVTFGNVVSLRTASRSDPAGDAPGGASPLAARGVTRIGVTSRRLGELIEVLQETKAAHELLVQRSMGLEDGGA